MMENLTTLAHAIGKNSAVALTFDDQNLAYDVLGGIPVDSEIKRATLYRPVKFITSAPEKNGLGGGTCRTCFGWVRTARATP